MGKQRRLRELRSLLRIKLALTAESLRAGEGFAEQMGKEVNEANETYRMAKGRMAQIGDSSRLDTLKSPKRENRIPLSPPMATESFGIDRSTEVTVWEVDE